MAWNDLKAAVAAVIKTNGTQAITGALLQSTLNSIIDQVGANASYKGLAIPSTNPGTPDGPQFYVASTDGTYSNFSGVSLFNEVAIINWNGSSWVKETFSFKNTEFWSTRNQYHVENSGVRSAIIDIKILNSVEGYYYALEQLYKNHPSVKDQVVMKRINASTGVEERFFWNNEAGEASGKTFVSLKAASASSGSSYACDIDMTIDYSLIVEGSGVGILGTTKMIINPALYFKASLVDSKISPLTLKIDGVYRTIPDKISTTCGVANGAIKNSESKFTIPVGQTGNDSIINLIPDWTKNLYVENSGITGKYIAKFKVSNWQSRTIDYFLFGSGVTTTSGTGVVSNGVMTCELSQNLSQYPSTVKLYMQLKSGTAVTGSDLVVEFDGFYIDPQTESQSSLAKSKEIYRTEKQIQQYLDSLNFSSTLNQNTADISQMKIDYNRVIPDDLYNTSCSVVNGAIKNSESKFTIPVGQTGNDSVIYLRPKWNKSLYTENDGLQVKFIAKFKVSNWQSRSIDYYIYGGSIVSKKGTGVVSNGFMTCEVIQTCSDDYEVGVGSVYMQLKSGTVVTGSDLVVEFDGFYIDPQTESQSSLAKSKEIYRTEKQILQVLSTSGAKEIIDARVPYTLTEITCKRFGTAGVDADFVGLNAIGDALASITDASSQKRYKILCEGVWLFTDPSDFVYDDGQFGEPTVIVGKDWIDVEGLGKDKTVVAVELAASSVFPSGKTYMDYQPVMWNSNSKLSNMSIVAKNCRYNVHFEGGSLVTNKTLTIDHCYLENKGNVEMGGSAGGTVFGTGMRDGQVWNIQNCTIKTKGGAFAMHTALNQVVRGGEVNLINCDIYGNVSLHNYSIERIINVNLINCRYNGLNIISYTWNYNALSIWADYADCIVKSTGSPLLFSNPSPKGKGLRVISKSTGSSSTVRFDQNCSAFSSIIGDINRSVEETTLWQWKFKYGFYYKDGGSTLKGFAVGGKDIDEGSTHTSLGKKLGNCTSVNKILTLIIDGLTYNITFNEDYTSQTNAYVISKITTVIGSVADVDVYSPGFEYYPQFEGMKTLENLDSTPILQGMAVKTESDSGIKKAINASEFEGICLDDVAPGQMGRVITSGRIYAMYETSQRFKILDVSSASVPLSTEFGISSTQPGYFDRTSSPKVLKAYAVNQLKFL